MAWPFGSQSSSASEPEDELSQERLSSMANVPVDEVPIPEEGEMSEDEAWTISPGPARVRTGAGQQEAEHQQVAAATPATVEATVDTSGLERMVSNRLDQVEDVLRSFELKIMDNIASMPERPSGSGSDATESQDAIGSSEQIVTATGEVISGSSTERLMKDDSAALLELYEAQALSVNPFLAKPEDIGTLGNSTEIGAHTVAALLLDHMTGMAGSSLVNKARNSGMLTQEEAKEVLAIVELAKPGEPDEALNDHLPDRELLTLSTLVTAWRTERARKGV